MVVESKSPTNLGYIFAILTGVVVSAFVAVPLLERRNPLGLMAFLLGPVLSVVLYRLVPWSRKPRSNASTRHQRLALAVAAFVLGPALSTLGAAIVVHVGDVHPLDRGPWIGMAAIIGFISGSVVAIALAVSAPLE